MCDHEFYVFVSVLLCLLESLLVLVSGCLEILSEINMNEMNNLQVIIFEVLIFLKSYPTMTL